MAILSMTAFSCTKEPLHNLSSTDIQTRDDATQKTAWHYIGERFGGGVIFFINKDSLYCLIADTVDLPQTAWWNGTTHFFTGATAVGIAAGARNTKKIISAQGRTARYAALECVKSRRGGYTDWFLPSYDELYKLYKHKDLVGGFTTSTQYYFYWTSSQRDGGYGNTAARIVDFNSGLRDESSYTSEVRFVRAIRVSFN